MIEEITAFGDTRRRFIDSTTGREVGPLEYTTTMNTTGITWGSSGTAIWTPDWTAPIGTASPTVTGVDWARPAQEFRPQPTPAPEPVEIKTERRIRLR